MLMNNLEEYLENHQIYTEVINATPDSRICTLFVQFDDTEKRVPGCGPIISKSGFTNLMRKFPENKWTMANYSYNAEEQAATVTFIAHEFLIGLIDATSLLAYRFGLHGVQQASEPLDAVIAELILLNEKYEQCYYSTLVVDEDLLDALRNDGEFLAGYLEQNSAVKDQLVVGEHYDSFIKQLDELSFHF